MKRLVVAVLLMGGSTGISANGDLADLITELKHIKNMVAQQKKAAVNHYGRMVFRYDLVERRIDILINDIEQHRALVNRQPRIELVDK